MSEYRIVGDVGPGKVKCKTEWLNADDDDPDGIKLGFELRGWVNVETEWREERA